MTKLLFLLMVAVSAVAETRTYLVKRAEHFSDDKYIYTPSPQEYKKFIDTGKKKWQDADGQPFKQTSYDINFDGKYALWRVTYVNATEKDRMDDYNNKKYIVLISSMDIVGVPSARGLESMLITTEITGMPTDFYRVAPSSGSIP